MDQSYQARKELLDNKYVQLRAQLERNYEKELSELNQVNGQAQKPKKQDWNCPTCGDFQFARNNSCRNSNTTRSLPNMTTTSNSIFSSQCNPNSNSAKPQEPKKKVEKKQDWVCLKCNDKQFARNLTCRKCGRAPPTPEEIAQDEADTAEKRRVAGLTTAERAKERQEKEARVRLKRLEWMAAQTAKGEALALSRDSECWARCILRYFEDRMRAKPEEESYRCSVTVEDDDYWAMTNRPLYEVGVRLDYSPGCETYRFQSWRNFDGKISIDEEFIWSESVMLYLVSYVDEFQRKFAHDRYDTNLKDYLPK
jgi:predicted RNA-binding Zn-ribbon protein involved in translation (DUF1610 family)